MRKPREHPAQELGWQDQGHEWVLRRDHQLNPYDAHYSRSVADAAHSVEFGALAVNLSRQDSYRDG